MTTLEKKLRKLRVWTKFKKAFTTKSTALEEYVKSETDITGAFYWSESKDGHNFWSDIEDKMLMLED